MRTTRVIGVDLGGTKILAGIVERDGTVVHHRETPTPLESQEALLADEFFQRSRPHPRR